jgi:hypothetical protein
MRVSTTWAGWSKRLDMGVLDLDIPNVGWLDVERLKMCVLNMAS